MLFSVKNQYITLFGYDTRLQHGQLNPLNAIEDIVLFLCISPHNGHLKSNFSDEYCV